MRARDNIDLVRQGASEALLSPISYKAIDSEETVSCVDDLKDSRISLTKSKTQTRSWISRDYLILLKMLQKPLEQHKDL